MKHRGNWGSSIGFILATAGSAIGLGNLWKFPYLTGQNGGGAFVVVYLALIIILGFSLMLGEMTLGRAGKSDAYGAYNNVKKGWGFIGGIGILCCFLIYSYYVVVAGWIVKYIGIFLSGELIEDSGKTFSNFISSGVEPIIYAFIVIIITALIVMRGVAGGIEKASKIMMPILFIFMLIIVARSVTLTGAMAGISYFLKPDFSLITPKVFLAALGQVFFSLSLGMGIVITYGSYLEKDSNLVKSAFVVPILDTAIALLSGLAILPAVFAFNLEPSEGAGMVFITLSKVFGEMPFGRIFGVIFFILVLFAALTSTLSIFEVVVAFVVDQFKIKRSFSSIIISLLTAVMAILNSNSFLPTAKKYFGKDFFSLSEYITDKLLLPLGGLLLCIFIGYVWNRNEIKKEVTNDGSLPFKFFNVWMFGIKYVGVQILALILLPTFSITGFKLVIASILILILQVTINVLQAKCKR